MVVTRETELKLRLPAGADDVVLRSAAALRSASPRTLQLDATYFDTPTRLLQANSMALRLRRVGRDWVQTLKAAAEAAGGLSTRPEWEAPATLRRGMPRIDLLQLGDTPLPALLAQHHATRKLAPVFRTRFARTLWVVDFRSSRIEVALDRGRIEAPVGRRTGRASIIRWEQQRHRQTFGQRRDGRSLFGAERSEDGEDTRVVGHGAEELHRHIRITASVTQLQRG